MLGVDISGLQTNVVTGKKGDACRKLDELTKAFEKVIILKVFDDEGPNMSVLVAYSKEPLEKEEG